MDKQHFLDTFRVTAPQMEQLTKTALKNGGDWSDLYFESTIYGDLLLKDGEVTQEAATLTSEWESGSSAEKGQDTHIPRIQP